jgi:hypothetical protein
MIERFFRRFSQNGKRFLAKSSGQALISIIGRFLPVLSFNRGGSPCGGRKRRLRLSGFHPVKIYP